MGGHGGSAWTGEVDEWFAVHRFGGVGFLGIKYIEYTSKFKDNIYWGTALYEEVEGVTHDLTVTEEAVGDDGVMVETR